jgi:transposase
MSFDFFLGIDVSKQTLDFALLNAEGKLLMQVQTENSGKAIEDLLHNLAAVDPQKLLICLEHTGIYNYPLLNAFAKATYSIWLESGKQIRYSMGVQRAKTDAIDALNIARYALKNQREARLCKPESKLLTQLKALAALPSRLIAAQNQLSLPLKEAKAFTDKDLIKTLEKAMAASLKALDKDLQQVNKQIEDLIKNDPHLNNLFNLLTSIAGIGTVTATQFILTTQAFSDGKNAKQFAAYAGVAPFPYQSGTSIRGRTKLSPIADKQMKTLLHLSAMGAIRTKGELQDYYQRKVKEGKNKMSVLNAIRNKLVLRAFAVVSSNRKYEKNYVYSLV